MFQDNDMRSILGWNDGTKFSINSKALGSPSVQFHEALHGRIFNETPDGQLHKLCCLAAKNLADSPHSETYSKIAEDLFNDTRIAHECAATYLAIIGMPEESTRKSEYGKLADEYKEYYRIMDELFVLCSSTTWLRYAFGWTFIHWCFHSNRYRTFFEKIEPEYSLIFEIDSPTDRFFQAKHFFSCGNRFSNWIQNSLKQASKDLKALGYEAWDFEDESAWDSRAGDPVLQIFENYITHHAGNWLLDNVPLDTEDFRVDHGDLPIGATALMNELKLIPTHLFNDINSLQDDGYNRQNLARMAQVHGNDKVEHNPQCRLFDLSGLDLANAMGPCLEAIPQSSHVIVLDIEGKPDTFAFLFRRRVGIADDQRFRFNEIASFAVPKQLAMLLIHGKLTGSLNPKHSPEVWVMLRTNISDSEKTANAVIDLLVDREFFEGKLSEPRLVIDEDKLIFYFTGAWDDLYRAGGMRFADYALNLMDTEESNDLKPISIRLAKPPSIIPSYVLAIKPTVSGYWLNSFEKKQFEEGNLEKLDITDDQIMSMMTPFLNAWHVWETF
jgi:hypothetical protein